MSAAPRTRKNGSEIYPMARPIAVRKVLVEALANTMPNGLFVETITRLVPALEPHLRHDPVTRPAGHVNIGEHLTTRDIHMIALVADGRTNGEIGELLHFSEETVKSRMRKIMGVLGASNRSHAVAVAIRHGLIP